MKFRCGAIVNCKIFFEIKKKCKIIKVIPVHSIEWTHDRIITRTLYKYVVEFKNGKQFTVNENKLSI